MCYFLANYTAKIPSSETQGQLDGAGKKLGRRKVKNEEKSPWGQGFNEPVPKRRGSSGFLLVPQNLCFFVPNHRAVKLGVVSCLLTRNIHTGQLLAIFVWVVR